MRASLLLLACPVAANPNKFEMVKTGGDTLCFSGGAYQFAQRKGTVKKLVVEMEGGGACWNDITCNPIKAVCTTSVSANKAKGLTTGIHDGTNPKNVFAEWYHVFVPYCSCDIHSGNADRTYTIGKKHHRGHVNFMAALNWTLANFPTDMTQVAVSGCSAGSAGTFINWPFVTNAYPTAKHSVFGDSYPGVFSESQWNKCYDHWNIQVPKFVPGVTDEKLSKWFDGISCYVQAQGAKWQPETQVGYYTSNADAVQTSFFSLGGGNPLAWTKTMRSLLTCYEQNTTTIHGYIAKGDAHCRSQDNGYYGVTAAGVNLAEWVSDLVQSTSRTAVKNVDFKDGEHDGDDAVKTIDLTGYANRLPYAQ